MFKDKEIRECFELMMNIPKFRYGIMEKAEELKARYRDEIGALKKAGAGLPLDQPAGSSAKIQGR